jgi:hypothetical protein
MFKIKLLVGLAAMVTTLVAITAPASAEFVINGQGSQARIKTFPEKTVFKPAPEGAAIECKSTNAEGKVVAEGELHVQVKQWTQQGQNKYQEPTKKGPHLQLKINKWGICTGPTGIEAKVKCNLQVEQRQPLTSSTGSVYPPGCEVVVGTEANNCTAKISAQGNQELSLVNLANVGTNEIEISSAVSGIQSGTSETLSLCKTLGIKGSANGEYKTSKPLIGEGLKLE